MNVLFTHADFRLLKPRRQLVHGNRMEQVVAVVRTSTGRVLAIEMNASNAHENRALVREFYTTRGQREAAKDVAWVVAATDYTSANPANNKNAAYHRSKSIDNVRY